MHETGYRTRVNHGFHPGIPDSDDDDRELTVSRQLSRGDSHYRPAVSGAVIWFTALAAGALSEMLG